MKRMKELKRKLSVLLVITLFISGLPVSYADVWASDDLAEYDLISDEGSTDVLREESDAGIGFPEEDEGTSLGVPTRSVWAE